MQLVIVPLNKSVTLPEASLIAAPPANITKIPYDIIDIRSANIVPLGIALAGSFKSPQMFAPACIPVTLGKKIAKTLKKS